MERNEEVRRSSSAERPRSKLVSVKVSRALLEKLTERFPETEDLSCSSKVSVFLRKLLVLSDEPSSRRPSADCRAPARAEEEGGGVG